MKCGKNKRTSEFYKNATREDGLQTHCMKCSKEYDLARTRTPKRKKRRVGRSNSEVILPRTLVRKARKEIESQMPDGYGITLTDAQCVEAVLQFVLTD
jgi:hypothetical protein